MRYDVSLEKSIYKPCCVSYKCLLIILLIYLNCKYKFNSFHPFKFFTLLFKCGGFPRRTKDTKLCFWTVGVDYQILSCVKTHSFCRHIDCMDYEKYFTLRNLEMKANDVFYTNDIRNIAVSNFVRHF